HVRGARGACAVPRPRPRRVCARAALEPAPRSLAHEAAAPSRRPPAPSVGGRAPSEARLRCPDGGVAPRPAPGRRARSARAGAPAPPASLRSVARLAAPRPPPARGRQPPEGALDAPHVPALGGGVPGRMRRRLLLVLVLAAGVFVWRLGRPGFSDTEGMFAEPAREMVETGDWVTPRMNGEPFLTKPPLAYWLAATVMAVRGPTEYARLVPALAALGTVAVTGALGTVLFGEAAGLAAAVVLVTSAGFLVEARLLRADMLLVLAITTALWAAASVRRRPSLGMAMLFWVALGLGTLDKGPVALVVPVAALALAVVVEGGAAVRAVVARLRAPLGLAVLAAIVVPWHLAAGARVVGGLLADVAAGRSRVGRGWLALPAGVAGAVAAAIALRDPDATIAALDATFPGHGLESLLRPAAATAAVGLGTIAVLLARRSAWPALVAAAAAAVVVFGFAEIAHERLEPLFSWR